MKGYTFVSLQFSCARYNPIIHAQRHPEMAFTAADFTGFVRMPVIRVEGIFRFPHQVKQFFPGRVSEFITRLLNDGPIGIVVANRRWNSEPAGQLDVQLYILPALQPFDKGFFDPGFIDHIVIN